MVQRTLQREQKVPEAANDYKGLLPSTLSMHGFPTQMEWKSRTDVVVVRSAERGL
jgi:hypothetical protein